MKEKETSGSSSSADTENELPVVRIKDLPIGTDLQGVRVKLPTHVYEHSSLPTYGIKNEPVYLQGWAMGDFFVKTDIGSSQIYPMFWTFIPWDIMEWEVVQ